MFMVVVAVLSIVLAFEGPVFAWVRTTWLTHALVAVATLAPPLGAWILQRQVLRRLDRDAAHPGDAQFLFGRGMTAVQWALGALHSGVLLTTDWLHVCRELPIVGGWLVAPSLIATLPLLVSLLLVWIAVYPADRAVRQVALEVYLFRGRPIRPVWPLIEYLQYNLRHQVLFILVPMFLIVLARDIIWNHLADLRTASGYQYFPDILLGLSAVVVALITPEILRHVWVTQRLPDGPLRDRLAAMTKLLKLRCREILVWRAGGALVNAAVMGLVAPLRYVLITDAMIEQMEDRKIEAVFGHEAGHIKRWHIFVLLLFAMISGCFVTIFSVRTQQGVSHEQYQILATIVGGALLLKWGVLFGWVSRRLERQADLFGVRVLAATGLPCYQSCSLHGETSADAPLSPDGALAPDDAQPRKNHPPPADALAPHAPLCRTAAHVYGATLHDVALLNGIPAEASSWRHGSIADRVRTVQRYATDPEAVRRFERSVARMQIVIAGLALGAGVWTALELRVWELLANLWGRLG